MESFFIFYTMSAYQPSVHFTEAAPAMTPGCDELQKHGPK
jgi:hypothetical protein